MIKKFFGGTFLDKEKLSYEGINYPIKLEYYKIYDKTKERNKLQFGIEVVKTEYQTQRTKIENKEIRGITKEEKVIENILKIISKNEVTPITTRDVIDDLTYDL
jgi:uncharacterized LabA/DUF88 family protein